VFYNVLVVFIMAQNVLDITTGSTVPKFVSVLRL
jgi:hypothetical protein